jgi:transcription factor IIIB subunit 2
MPILAEDLIWRFTSKLDFGELNDKVAEDAIRMSRRMSKDWMVMGRRPAGVVGACIIMAARMNNFRRTVTEVVYVVKVTTQTVTKRLEEFKETASSDMTVGEFLSNHFIETAQDPPSFYQQTEEWKSKQKKRKRRDMGNDGYNSEEEFSGDEGNSPDKRRRTEETNSGPTIELRKDADGFSIPPLPTPAPTATPASSATAIPISEPLDMAEVPIDPELMDARIEKEIGATFQQLVNQFGDQLQDVEIADVEGNSNTTTTEPAKRGRKPAQELRVSPEWENSERSWETEITEMISDPNTMQHAANYAMAKRRVAAHMLVAQIESPGRQISMDTHIGEDEFADDPEVQNCLLSEEDVKKKEMVWVNENQSWLRQQQKKMWDAKQAENRPPKARRNRKPKAQMGTGQKSPANSPAEAAINVLKERAFSKKINYKSMEDVFKNVSFLKNKTMGSAATSRASSEFGESETESASRAASEAPSVNDSEQSFNAAPKPRGRPTPAAKSVDIDDDEEGDEDDYINPDAPESPTARRRTIPTEDETADDWKDGFEEGDEMEEDFDDAGMGDIEDDDDGAFAERDFGNDDDDGYGVDDEY